MNKRIRILIPDADTPLAVKVSTSLGIAGYTAIYGISLRKNNRIKYSKYCKVFTADAKNSRDFLEFVMKVIIKNRIDFILPVRQAGIQFCNNYRSDLVEITRLGLIPNLEQLNHVNYKDSLCKYLKINNLPYPSTYQLSGLGKDNWSKANLNFPVLLKPTGRSGGKGIIKCSDIDELNFRLNNLNVDDIGNYIIQEFVNGLDAGFSCICKDGKIISYTIHKALLPPYKTYQIPLSIEFIKDNKILNLVSNLIRLLQWNGVFDVDLILENDSHNIKILEVNPRFWASLYASHNAGINFADVYVRASIGEKIPQQDFNENRFIRLKLGMLKNINFYLRNFSFRESDLKYLMHDLRPELAVKFLNAS